MPSFVFSEDDDCSKLENDQCDNYTPPEGENDDKNCIYDIASSKCKLKECKDMDPKECSLFIPRNYLYSCMKIGDSCELKQCSDFQPPNCGNFETRNDQKCIINGSNCTPKKCSDYRDPFCESFIPNDKSKKCFNTGEGCGIKNKECDEFINEECHYYVPNADDKNLDKKCIPSESGNCSLSSCESLNAAECQNFGDNNGDKQCINIDGSCKLVECKDLPDNQCNKFTTDNLYYKCISKNNECAGEIKECSELPIEFCQDEEKKILNDCVFNANENKCEIKRPQLDNSNANNKGGNQDDKKSGSNSSGSNNSGSDSSDSNNSNIPQKIHFTLLTFFIFSILF